MKVIVLSPTQQEFDGIVYYRCGFYFQRKGARLHKAVWEHHHGPVPDGCHIHHKDANRTNNDIDNLVLMPARKHLSMHSSARPEYLAKHIKMMQDKAKEWHASEDGRAWHIAHGRRCMMNRELSTYVCTQCGKQYKTIALHPAGSNTFCSNKCRALHRRKSGVDDVDRACEKCGEVFRANQYSKARFCRECFPRRR